MHLSFFASQSGLPGAAAQSALERQLLGVGGPESGSVPPSGSSPGPASPAVPEPATPPELDAAAPPLAVEPPLAVTEPPLPLVEPPLAVVEPPLPLVDPPLAVEPPLLLAPPLSGVGEPGFESFPQATTRAAHDRKERTEGRRRM